MENEVYNIVLGLIEDNEDWETETLQNMYELISRFVDGNKGSLYETSKAIGDELFSRGIDVSGGDDCTMCGGIGEVADPSISLRLPVEYIICERCNGTGKYKRT